MPHNVTYARQDYADALQDWAIVRDVIAGERAVKAKGETYLPNPNAVEDGQEARHIYQRYIQRASFYNVTGQTVRSLIGSAFRKWPQFEAPPLVEYLEKDADGNGVSIYQQSQSVALSTLSVGRHALFVDYPRTDGPVSRADLEAGRVRANVVPLAAEQVINWRTTTVGGKHMLSLVVFREYIDVDTEDGFGMDTEPRWRVLRLEDGVYTQEIWKVVDNEAVIEDGPFAPTDGAGNTWSFIPFTFVGSRNNDTDIDHPPMLDMSRVNLKHYQLAADWYNALFYAGQPQPWMAGLDEAWRDWLVENGYVVGSRSVIPLPAGGQFAFATVTADSAIQKEIKDIEERLVSLGARIVKPGGAIRTATQAQSEQEQEHSVLSLVVENVNEAYNQCIKWALMFMDRAGQSVSDEGINYRIDSDFTQQHAEANMVMAAVALFNSGKWPESDLFTWLRKNELVDPSKTDDEIREELEGQALNAPRLPLE